MTLARLIRRSLLFYWRTGVVVIFGLAVATAVITGSLLIGDSVTGSLRETALARLGRIEYALVAPHYFRAELARDLLAVPTIGLRDPRIVPAIVTQGAVQNLASGATLPHVSVIGAADEFWKLYREQPARELAGRQVAVNAALAGDLELTDGDFLLLTVPRGSVVPSETLFARRSLADTTRSLRLQAKVILPDAGVGGFRLDAGTAVPRNLFLARDWLATQLGEGDVANALLVEIVPHFTTPPDTDGLTSELAGACTVTDYGLELVPQPTGGYLSLESRSVVLEKWQVEAARRAAADCGARCALTSVYLATSITNTTDSRSGEEIAYAVVAGSDPLWSKLHSQSGAPLDRNSIWLNTWAARDLSARVGDVVKLTYLVPSREGTYHTGITELMVRGIAAMTGQGADPGLVPDFEGITDAERMGDWHPPFPVDLGRITPRDEAYWDRYRAAPKAFVHMQTVQAMWASGPAGEESDWVTSVRIMPAAGVADLVALKQEFTHALLQRLSPREAGLTFRPLRRVVLDAARGTTDFSQLMLGMSMFLVLAGAGLAGMLLRLSAARRAAEAGIMRACGCRARTAARAILAEGAVLTLLGVVVGVPLGVLYAWGIITALTTWWSGALTSTPLWLYIQPSSLLGGALSGLVVGLLATAWGARALGRRPVRELLSGWQALAVVPALARRDWAGPALGLFLLAAAVLLLLSAGAGLLSSATAFFGSGFLLLLAGVAAASLVLARALAQRGAYRSWGALALRSSAGNRGRSLLVIGLLASATFVVVAVAANSRDLSRIDTARRDSGAGGFALRAISSLPLHYDLGSPAGRAHLGFSSEHEKLLAETEVVYFLVSPGQDISCLNLSRPSHPRVLGVSDAMISRGGFPVVTATAADNPWRLLHEPVTDGAIPACGDADTVRWSLHSGLGATYQIPDGKGRAVPLRFVGVIPRSIFASELLVAEAHFKRLFPGVDAPSYFLIATPAGKEAQVAQALREVLGGQGLAVRSTREVLDSFLRVQNTYLMMFLALGGLGLLLGSLGLVAVLLRNALERRAEFALMLATGFTRNNLARLLLIENGGLLLAGLLWGTLSALVAVAPQLLSVEARVNWGALALVLAATIIVGLVASAVAAPLAVRGNLLAALREE